MTAPLPPLVGIYFDIDGTIVIPIVTFWLLVLVLNKLVFQRFLQVVEWREEGISGSREDAKEMEARAEELKEEYHEKERQARREAQEVRQSLRDQGMQEQKQRFEEVREEIRDKITAERDEIQQQVDRARDEMEERARDLASAMVAKILPET